MRAFSVLAFVIVAALPASGVAYAGQDAPVAPVAVNLPDPQHPCAQLLKLAGREYHTDRFPKDAETIGKLYHVAIDLNGTPPGAPDTFENISLTQLIQAYSDLMGCFVSHPPAPAVIPTPGLSRRLHG